MPRGPKGEKCPAGVIGAALRTPLDGVSLIYNP
jgi:hypothetical protein